MRHSLIIVLFSLLVISCKEEEAPPVEFRIRTVGFSLEDVFSAGTDQKPQLQSQLSGGILSFNTSRKSHTFDTGLLSVEEYSFSLPEGEYQLEATMPPASIYGQGLATFAADRQAVVISKDTDTLEIIIRATCSQFVVYDENNQLDSGIFMIERYDYANNYFISYPLERDSANDYYYTYFTPDNFSESPSAFLWLYNDKPDQKEGGLSTTDLETGKRYHIVVLE